MKEWICVDCGEPAGWRRKRCPKCKKKWRKDYNLKYYAKYRARYLAYQSDYIRTHRITTNDMDLPRRKRDTTVAAIQLQRAANPGKWLDDVFSGKVKIV